MRVRFVRKARLEARFKETARPLTLDEFLRLIWPKATEKDLRLMWRWAQLREVGTLLHINTFRGQEADLGRIFDLLDARGDGRVCMHDVVRSRMLSTEEVQRIVKSEDLRHVHLDKESFRGVLWPELRARYLKADTLAKMKREEEATMNNTFVGAFGINVDKTGAK